MTPGFDVETVGRVRITSAAYDRMRGSRAGGRYKVVSVIRCQRLHSSNSPPLVAFHQDSYDLGLGRAGFPLQSSGRGLTLPRIRLKSASVAYLSNARGAHETSSAASWSLYDGPTPVPLDRIGKS